MPKRLRKRKKGRSDDINEIAHQLVARVTGDAPVPSAISQIMAEMGRRGGKKGGKARADKMTQEQRTASASKAARARWAKEKK